ncbi:FAM172 family protein [Skeletonema marinoi]|uniref:FAM172 family protein n=1 Tax=Skeletonema marinoi TaxID=267567 RepID=A0AAD9D843_9STRA|nr:FAM172 family protein [Skeletonema marinoi]
MGGTQSSQSDPTTTVAVTGTGCSGGPRPIPKNFTLLHGCFTMEEHEHKIAADVAIAKGLKGKDALSALGFEFRFVPCDLRMEEMNVSSPDEAEEDRHAKQPSTKLSRKASCASFLSLSDESYGSGQRYQCCHDCATRLFYICGSSAETTDESSPPSDASTMITLSNRKQFIADGPHYDLIANMAQETAQSIMCSEFNLEWVTVCSDRNLGPDVRAMVDADHPLLLEEGENKAALQELLLGGNATTEEKKDDSVIPTDVSINKTKATLLIATGRGKVRAGIFSRQHLLTAGIEIGTAWHFIREARLRRGWGIAVIDPNARGEGVGFDTFKRSFSRLFVADDDASNNVSDESTKPMSRQQSVNSLSTSTQSSPIYILAHSAGGGQLVRHLREDSTLLPSIKAIAFTDSSHNVQWCKSQPTLMEFLQQKNCVYVRSNDVRSSQSCVKVSSRGKDIQCGDERCSCITQASGKLVNTDNFWEHRFGKIKTIWAGSPDHSLSNYAGRFAIFDHFDEHAKEEATDDCH